MDLFLAGNDPWREKGVYDETIKKGVKILESFCYVDKWSEWLIPQTEKYLLDSGAFTYLYSNKGKSGVDWNDYIARYADFINRNDVKLFFELDIDSIVGYENVIKLRKRLEAETGKKPIVVWHPNRGKDEFLKSCEEYPYVALGGIVGAEISRAQYEKRFPWFIQEAHKRGAKIHGLGYTKLKGLEVNHFDSVDSTSWLSGNRFGSVYRFNGKTIEQVGRKPGQRMKNTKALAAHNFDEWVKFQKYAATHL